MFARILDLVCGGLFLLGVTAAVAGGWTYFHGDPAGDAWVVEQPEQIVTDAKTGQKIRVPFRLRNTSSRPCRIVGTTAC